MDKEECDCREEAEEPLLNVDDVARWLNVPKKWVYAKAEAGKLPSLKIGVYRRFRRGDLRNFLETAEAPMENGSSDVTDSLLVRRPPRSARQSFQ